MAEQAKKSLREESFEKARNYYWMLLEMDSTQVQARRNLKLVESIIANEKGN